MVCGCCGEEQVEDHWLLCLVLVDYDNIKTTWMCVVGAMKSKWPPAVTWSWCWKCSPWRMCWCANSLVRLPNFFVIWNELSNLTFSRSTILFRFFFRCGWTVPPLLEHKVLRFLYSSVEISFVAVWRSLLRHPCLSCVAGNPSFNGVASPNHLSLSFTWCGFSRSPFPFLYLVRLFWKNLSRVWPF